jgi:hypothetical protein
MYQYAFSASLLCDGAPSDVHFQQRFHSISVGRNNVTLAQVPNSSEESPSAFCHEALHPYFKPGMRPARGCNAGVTEVPRIGQVGSWKNEHAPQCLLMGTSSIGQPMSHFQSLPILTIHHTGLIPFHSTPDRGAQPSFEMVLPAAGPSSPSADEGKNHLSQV